jgi:hypothetical protein
MFERIVDNFLAVALGTGIDMVALLFAPAGHDAPGSAFFTGVQNRLALAFFANALSLSLFPIYFLVASRNLFRSSSV